jgi:hypothetical protein
MPVNGVLHVKEANQTNFMSLINTDQNFLTYQNRGVSEYHLTYSATPSFN